MPKKNSTRKYNRSEIGSVYATLDEIMYKGITPANKIKQLEQLLNWALKRQEFEISRKLGADESHTSKLHKIYNADDMVTTIQRHLNTLKPVSKNTSPLEAARAASPPMTYHPSARAASPRMTQRSLPQSSPRRTQRSSAHAASPPMSHQALSNSAIALQLQLEEIPTMRVVDLKEALRTAGQSVSGKKADLVARYSEFLVKKSK